MSGPDSCTFGALDDEALLRCLALVTRKHGRFPTYPELNLEHTADSTFTTAKTFTKRLGRKSTQVARLRAFAQAIDEFADVHKMLSTEKGADTTERCADDIPGNPDGYVYLIRSGRCHKIGRSNNIRARRAEPGGTLLPIPS